LAQAESVIRSFHFTERELSQVMRFFGPSVVAAAPLCNVLYFVGDNNLEAGIVQDVEEIISNKAAMNSSDYLPLIFLDRYNSSTGSSAPIAGLMKEGQPAPYFSGIRYLRKNFQEGTLEVHRELSEDVSDSQDVMTEFFTWAFQACKTWNSDAEIFLVFGGHGAGWKGIGGDFDGAALFAAPGGVSGLGEDTRGYSEVGGSRRLATAKMPDSLRDYLTATAEAISGHDAGADGGGFVEMDDHHELTRITRAASSAAGASQLDGVRRLFAQATSAKAALRQAMDAAGIQQLDVLGFDACIMGTYAVFGQFADLTRWIMASESTEPKHGWDFSKAVPDTAVSMARDLLNGFIDLEIDGKHEAPKILALVQSSDFLSFQATWEELALHLTAGLLQGEKTLLLKMARARGTSLSFAGAVDSLLVNPPSSADMGDFLKQFNTSCGVGGAASTLLDAAISAYTSMIENGTMRAGVGSPGRATGLSVLFPTRQAETEYGVWSDHAAAVKAATPTQLAWADFVDAFVAATVGTNEDVSCMHMSSSEVVADDLILDAGGRRVRGVSYFAVAVAPTTESVILEIGYEWDFKRARRLSTSCVNCTSSPTESAGARRGAADMPTVGFFGGRVHGTIDENNIWAAVWNGRFHMFSQGNTQDDIYVDQIDDTTMLIPVLWWSPGIQPQRNDRRAIQTDGAFLCVVVVGLGDSGRAVTGFGLYCKIGSTFSEIPRGYGGLMAPLIFSSPSIAFRVGGFSNSLFDWSLPLRIGYYTDASCFTDSFSTQLRHRLTATGTLPSHGAGMWRDRTTFTIIPPEWASCGEKARPPVDPLDCVEETRFLGVLGKLVVKAVEGALEEVKQIPVFGDIIGFFTSTAEWMVDEIGKCLKEDLGQEDKYLEAEFPNGGMRLDLVTQELKAHCTETSAQEVVGSRTDLEWWESDESSNCPAGALLGRYVSVATKASVDLTHKPQEKDLDLRLNLSASVAVGMSVRAAGPCSFEKNMLIHEQPKVLFNECVGVSCFAVVLQYQIHVKALGAPAHSSFEYGGTLGAAGNVFLRLDALDDADLDGVVLTRQVDTWVVNGQLKDGTSSWVQLEVTPVLTIVFAPHSYVSVYLGIAGHLAFTGAGSYQRGDGAVLPPLDGSYPRNCSIQQVAPAATPEYGGVSLVRPTGPGAFFSDANPRECLSASAMLLSSARLTVRALPVGSDLSALKKQMCTNFAKDFPGWTDTSFRIPGWMRTAKTVKGFMGGYAKDCLMFALGYEITGLGDFDEDACDKFLDTIDPRVVDTEPAAIARTMSCSELSSAVVADGAQCNAKSDRITCGTAVQEAQERLGMVGDGASDTTGTTSTTGTTGTTGEPEVPVTCCGAASHGVLIVIAALVMRLTDACGTV